MTTVANLIERTKRHLYGGEVRDERNQLSGSLTAEAVGLGIQYDQRGIQPGATLAIGLEELYVWDVTGGTNVVVERGANGTTAATHDTGDTIVVNPKFSPFAILQAINEDILALPSEGLFAIGAADIDYQSGTDSYDLDSDTAVLNVIDVETPVMDGTGRWASLATRDWRFIRNLPTDSFASGQALTINGWASSGQTLRVTYKTVFTEVASLTDVVETVSGLPSTALDIVAMGAAIRLNAGAEIARNFLDQGETRRSDEVGPGSRNAQSRLLLALRQQRLEEEKSRLYAQYPERR